MPIPSVITSTDALISCQDQTRGVGNELAAFQNGAATSATWPTASKAYYVPLYLPTGINVAQLWWLNGAAVSGTSDCGIYHESGARIVSTGSTTNSGITAIQSVNITDTWLDPGRYYMALAASTTGQRVYRIAASATVMRFIGCAEQASASPLPSTFTLAAVTSAFLPIFGIAVRSSP